MKKALFSSLFMLFAVFTYAGTSSYYVDDSAIEDKLTTSAQVNLADINLSGQIDLMNITSVQAENPNPWVAFALAWVLGGIGVHRVYLGGKGSLILIYFITCGGIFGIVPLIDWIVLLVGAIKDDIGAYVNNDAFFMWN